MQGCTVVPIYTMPCQDLCCISLSRRAPGSASHPQKKLSLVLYLWLDIKPPAGPWFPMSGNALQRCLGKQIAGTVTLLMRTWPIHLCPLFDVLEWAEHSNGLFHWHLVWWIKHQCGLRIECLNTRTENAHGSYRTGFNPWPSAGKMASCFRPCPAYFQRLCDHFRIVSPWLDCK